MIIFGVGRLTEIGGSMGKAIKEFRKSQEDDPLQPEVSDSESKVEEKSTT